MMNDDNAKERANDTSPKDKKLVDSFPSKRVQRMCAKQPDSPKSVDAPSLGNFSCRSVPVLILWAIFCLQQHHCAAGNGAFATLTKSPPRRQPWLTLYGPLRLGVDSDDDNHTLSALGTWLRLDCPADEEGRPLRPQPGRQDLSWSRISVQPSWPMSSHAFAATPPDIIFFTDDHGETCKLLQAALGLDQQGIKHWEDMWTRVRCLNECVHPQHGRLDVACIIEHASKTARTPVMSLVNSDIALGPDFVSTMQGLFFLRPDASTQGTPPNSLSKNSAGDSMLVIGRRTDLNLPTPRIDFQGENWGTALHDLATQQGRLHSEYGIDYFATARPGIWARSENKLPRYADDDDNDQARNILKTTFFLDDQRSTIAMPPFLVGVYRWDSFAVAQAILSPSIAVVDATAAVMAMHLQRATAGEPPQHRQRRGASYNDRLVHNLIGKRYLMGTTLNADYELTAGGELLARVSPLAM